MNKTITFFILLLGVLIGVYRGFFNSGVFGTILEILLVVLGIVTISIIGASLKLNFRFWIGIGLALLISLALSFGTTHLTKFLIDRHMQNTAQSVILIIEEFKSKNGELPYNPYELGSTEQIYSVNYKLDSTSQHYSLGYATHSHYKSYSSRTGKWTVSACEQCD